MKSIGISLPDMEAKFAGAQKMAQQTFQHFDARLVALTEQNARIEAKLDAVLGKQAQIG